jgi:hypothetical protein
MSMEMMLRAMGLDLGDLEERIQRVLKSLNETVLHFDNRLTQIETKIDALHQKLEPTQKALDLYLEEPNGRSKRKNQSRTARA